MADRYSVEVMAPYDTLPRPVRDLLKDVDIDAEDVHDMIEWFGQETTIRRLQKMKAKTYRGLKT